MLIGTLKIRINLMGITSLKDKRRIVKSIIGRLQSRFNFSIAEVAEHDSRQTAVLGIAVVSNDSVFIQQQLDKAIDFARADGRFFIATTDTEIFSSHK